MDESRGDKKKAVYSFGRGETKKQNKKRKKRTSGVFISSKRGKVELMDGQGVSRVG